MDVLKIRFEESNIIRFVWISKNQRKLSNIYRKKKNFSNEFFDFLSILSLFSINNSKILI